MKNSQIFSHLALKLERNWNSRIKIIKNFCYVQAQISEGITDEHFQLLIDTITHYQIPDEFMSQYSLKLLLRVLLGMEQAPQYSFAAEKKSLDQSSLPKMDKSLTKSQSHNLMEAFIQRNQVKNKLEASKNKNSLVKVLRKSVEPFSKPQSELQKFINETQGLNRYENASQLISPKRPYQLLKEDDQHISNDNLRRKKLLLENLIVSLVFIFSWRGPRRNQRRGDMGLALFQQVRLIND